MIFLNQLYIAFNRRILVALLLLGFFNSCTRLQYRESDKELMEKFEAIQLEPNITYFRIDSLKAKIRVLKISKPSNKINVVFLHGSPSSLSSWTRYLKDSLLLSKANLWAIDRPGLGYSNFGRSMPSIDLQAQVLNNIFKDLRIKDIIIVGTSYGGPVAARIALQNEEVKGGILISSAMDPKLERQFWGSRLTQWWATRWLVPTGYRVAGDEKTIHAQELSKLEMDWAKLKIPITHIHGTKDDIVPFENVKFTKEHFKNIKIISVPNAGHEISYRRSELVLPLIIELIESLEY
tara:strand:- start:2966 stop:3844 length:879 start_codon:yes stop_codon:yes gene_type:complete